MGFMSDLRQAWERHDSLVCVGLDPEPARFPAVLRGHPDAVYAFCRAVVDSTFLACPVCTTKLKEACRRCKAPLEPLWQICPYCETPVESPRAVGNL